MLKRSIPLFVALALALIVLPAVNAAWSKPPSATLHEPPSATLQIYPNPVQQQANVSLSVPERQRVTVALFDVLGRQLETLYRGPLAPHRSYQFHLDAGALTSGLYLVRVQGDTFTLTRHLVVAG